MNDPLCYAGCKFRKYFPRHGWFSGQVNEIWQDNQGNLNFHVLYEDGDQEDMSLTEVQKTLDAYDSINKTMAVESDTKRQCIPDLWQITKVPKDKGLVLETIREALPNECRECAQRVADFFLFVHERHKIWERRKLGREAPYSDCLALQNYFFCNNYRELDRGTKYFRAQMLRLWEGQACLVDRQTWLNLVLWASVCYRMCNLIETFEAFGTIPKVSEWKEFCTAIRSRKSQGRTVFTMAHIVVGFERYMATLKLLGENDARLLQQVGKEILQCCLEGEKDGICALERCFMAVKTIRNVGNFFAWQIICDLLESQCLQPCTETDWTQLGPGAKGGIDVIFGQGMGARQGLGLAKLLVNIQCKVYNAIGVQFPFLHDQPFTLKTVEHTLCEFSKFDRIHNKLRSGHQRVQGQRLAKWRSASDRKKKCYFVDKCGNSKDVVIMCDKCLNGYCRSCCVVDKENTPRPGTFWVCRRCAEFEAISLN